jgi:hypothetical protein
VEFQWKELRANTSRDGAAAFQYPMHFLSLPEAPLLAVFAYLNTHDLLHCVQASNRDHGQLLNAEAMVCIIISYASISNPSSTNPWHGNTRLSFLDQV